MINLRDYARNNKSKEKTDVLTARLPVSKITAFKQLCDDLGLKVSEAIGLLVDDQLKQNRIQKEIEVNKEDTNVYQPVSKKETSCIQTNTDSRFTLAKWKVDKSIPCPICKEWTSYSNYARHTDSKHNGMTPQDVYTNEEYVKIADQMVKEQKENKL